MIVIIKMKRNVYCLIWICRKALTDLDVLSFCVAGGEVHQILWTDVSEVQCWCWEQVGLTSFLFVFWCLSSGLGIGSVMAFSFFISASTVKYYFSVFQGLNKSCSLRIYVCTNCWRIKSSFRYSLTTLTAQFSALFWPFVFLPPFCLLIFGQ